jgi:hypothetical protein
MKLKSRSVTLRFTLSTSVRAVNRGRCNGLIICCHPNAGARLVYSPAPLLTPRKRRCKNRHWTPPASGGAVPQSHFLKHTIASLIMS